MIKHFYSYHVEIESIIIEVESLPIKDREKKHLISLAESQIHSSIIDTILLELDEDNKKEFLRYLNTKDHEKIWKFLREKITDVEEKITDTAKEIKKQLRDDLVEAKD